MSIETTQKAPELYNQLSVPEVRDYDILRQQAEQCVADDPEQLEDQNDANRIIISVERLSRHLAERRCGDSINIGDVYYDEVSFATRTPEGSGLEEVYKIHTITNNASSKRPRKVCEVKIFLDDRQRNIRLDSKNSSVEVTDQYDNGDPVVLTDIGQDMAIFDLECRILIAQEAAMRRPLTERVEADNSARKLYKQYLSNKTTDYQSQA